MQQRNQQGFTLAEVMIAIAILGILSVIAVPSYLAYVERGHLANARAELLKINMQIKTERVKNPKLTQADLDTKIKNFTGAADKTVSDHYEISLARPDKNSTFYYLLALPTNEQHTKALLVVSAGSTYQCSNKKAAEDAAKERATPGSDCKKV